jgi:binding-protein-dependent transport system inner membrane component
MVHKKGIQLSGIFIYTALSLLFIITFYPFWNIFVLSLNDATDSLRGGLMLWPRVFSIDSYKAVLSDTALLSSLKVTLLRTAVGVPMNLLAVTTLAYALSQRDLIGRRQINLLFVFTMYFSGGLIPTYMIVKWLGLIDNFLVYLLPGLYNVYWMILVRTYMEGLPYSMIESARIDGANDIQIFAKVVLPSCAPVVATIGLFSAIYHWNAWYDSYIYTNKPVLETLSNALIKILNQYQTGAMMTQAQQMAAASKRLPVSSESIRMTVTMVTTIPIILVYPFVQKYFIKGMMLGSVKE